MKTGAELIAEERLRQINVEGWSPEWDDQYKVNQLEDYAKFLMTGNDFYFPVGWDEIWKIKRFKRTHKENLIKAGALIAAELDRMIRQDVEKESTLA